MLYCNDIRKNILQSCNPRKARVAARRLSFLGGRGVKTPEKGAGRWGAGFLAVGKEERRVGGRTLQGSGA